MKTLKPEYISKKPTILFDLSISALIGLIISFSIILLVIIIVGFYIKIFFPVSILCEGISIYISNALISVWPYPIIDIASIILPALLPIISAILGISCLRFLIIRAENKKQWILLMFANMIIASLVGFLPPLVDWKYSTIIDNIVYLFPAVVKIVLLVAIFIGLSINFIFIPKNHVGKIISSSVVAGLIGGFLEFLFILQILLALSD